MKKQMKRLLIGVVLIAVQSVSNASIVSFDYTGPITWTSPHSGGVLTIDGVNFSKGEKIEIAGMIDTSDLIPTCSLPQNEWPGNSVYISVRGQTSSFLTFSLLDLNGDKIFSETRPDVSLVLYPSSHSIEIFAPKLTSSLGFIRQIPGIENFENISLVNNDATYQSMWYYGLSGRGVESYSTPVPEPSSFITIGLLAIGFGAHLAVKYSKRNSQKISS